MYQLCQKSISTKIRIYASTLLKHQEQLENDQHLFHSKQLLRNSHIQKPTLKIICTSHGSIKLSLSAEIETLSHVLSLVEAFRSFDSDNDGSINVQELGGLMGSLGYNPSEQEINTLMQEANTNRDGLLSISEFLDMNTKDLGLGGLKDILKRAFEELEFQGEDLVTGEDLYEVIGNIGTVLSQDECLDIIASMDGDGDGVISFEDFKLIINSLG